MRWLVLFLSLWITLPVLAQSTQRQYPQPASENTDSSSTGSQTTTEQRTPEPAADLTPVLQVELPDGDPLVGQPLVLSVRILVPTYMPKPPSYPNLEVPNLLVRLPERSTSPVSERIDGESWSGTQRRYRLYPLAPGVYELPLTAITVTYADPETNAPVEATLEPETVNFTAVMPAGAETLSPPIVASSFTLEQQIEGETELASGEAFTRRLIAKIEGTTPILIPALTPEVAGTALRSYPKEPKITETEQRGSLSGQRLEETVYMGQAGGEITLPEISIDWFNIDTGTLETASVEAIDLTVAAPPPPPPSPAALIRRAIVVAGTLLLLWIGYRRFAAPIRTAVLRLRQTWRNSEPYAAGRVRSAIRSRALSDTYTALDDWSDRFGAELTHSNAAAELSKCLSNLGQAKFAQAADPAVNTWDDTLRTFEALRRARQSASSTLVLPPLNPVSSDKT